MIHVAKIEELSEDSERKAQERHKKMLQTYNQFIYLSTYCVIFLVEYYTLFSKDYPS